MTSKTSILAIGIVAILMTCALSGAVVIANSGSNNNGTADVSPISNVRVTSNITEKTYTTTNYQSTFSSAEETVMPMLPDVITDFDDVIADVADDTLLSDFLDGRTFEMNDIVYTIDSDTAALSYLYSLGYVSIGRMLVLDTYGFNMTETTEEIAVAVPEADQADYGNTIVGEKDAVESQKVLMTVATPKVGVELQAHLLCENVSRYSYEFLDFADLTVADFRDANILIEPSFEAASTTVEEMDDEDIDMKKVFSDFERASSYRSFMMDTLCDFMYATVTEDEDIYYGSILDALYGSVFAIDGVPMAVEDAQTLAIYLYYNFGFQIVGTSIIAIDYVPFFVTTRSDADIEMIMGEKEMCRDMVNEEGIAFASVKCVRNCYEDLDFTFFDVATVSPYIFTDIVDDDCCVMSIMYSEKMGNAFASNVLSSFIMFGNTSNEDVYSFFGMFTEKVEVECVENVKDEVRVDLLERAYEEETEDDIIDCIKKECDDMSDLPTVLDVFMNTPFFFDGELMIVSDIDTLGLYLSQQYLIITNENEFMFATFDYDGEFDGMMSMDLEDLPAKMFEKFLSNDYFNTCGMGDNVYDGGYFCSGQKFDLQQTQFRLESAQTVAQGAYVAY